MDESTHVRQAAARPPRAVGDLENPDRSAQGVLPADLVRLAWLMDSSVRLPGGHRIGLDGLIGLVPGIGDAIGVAVSLYIVARAHRLGLSRGTLARMLLNIGTEGLVGTVPVIGDVFDFAFKANQRNLALLRRKLDLGAEPRRGRRARRA